MEQLQMTISGPEGASDSTIATMSRDLAADLRSAAKVTAEPRRSPAEPKRSPEGEPGTKSGTAVELGALVITGIFSAATMSAISDVLRVWITRRRAGVITLVKGDRMVQVRGLTEEQLRAELDELIALFQEDEEQK